MEPDVFNILMVGVGGQGIVLASDILTLVGMLSGYDVKKSEIHGMSQRGGSVFSHIRFGEKVFSPTIPAGKAHILLSLELMETLRWVPLLNTRTRLIISKTEILPTGMKDYPSGIDTWISAHCTEVTFVEPDELTQKTGNRKYTNVALLGLISTYLDFPKKAWQTGIAELVPAGTGKDNIEAFSIAKRIHY